MATKSCRLETYCIPAGMSGLGEAAGFGFASRPRTFATTTPDTAPTSRMLRPRVTGAASIICSICCTSSAVGPPLVTNTSMQSFGAYGGSHGRADRISTGTWARKLFIFCATCPPFISGIS